MRINRYLTLGFVLLVGGALLWGASASRQQTAADIHRAKNERIVQDHYRKDIDRAKAENKTKIILPQVNEFPVAVGSIEEAMRNCSWLRVKVIDKEIIVSEPYAFIETWYRLEVVETLHQQKVIDDSPLPDTVPSEFLPLLPSECLMVRPGGTVIVDGVSVTRAIEKTQFELKPQEEYIIGAYVVYGGKLITPFAQAAGVFHIENGSLKSLDKTHRELAREIEESLGGDLHRFRSHIRSKQERQK